MRVQEVALKADGIKIAGKLYLPDGGNQPNYPAVCICHGIPSGFPPDPNDGGYPVLAEKVCRGGFAVFIFNFRGTGDSGGNLDMLGWSKDLETGIDYLASVPEVDNSRLILLGYSAGAAVSVYVAARDKRIAAVASCACPAELNFSGESGKPENLLDRFREIGAIRDKEFPDSLDSWIDGFRRINPISCINNIAPRPLLVIHGSGDDVVNVEHARRLYEKAGEPKQMFIIEGAGHRLRRDEQAVTFIMEWLQAQR